MIQIYFILHKTGPNGINTCIVKRRTKSGYKDINAGRYKQLTTTLFLSRVKHLDCNHAVFNPSGLVWCISSVYQGLKDYGRWQWTYTVNPFSEIFAHALNYMMKFVYLPPHTSISSVNPGSYFM